MSEWKCVSHKRIDAARWDACIERQGGEVFSEAWYWNAVCKTWKGWIKGDYEAVIPWPLQHKFAVIPSLKTPLYVKWIEGDEAQIKQALGKYRGLKKIHLLFERPGAKPRQVQLLQLNSSWQPSSELTKNLRKAEKSNPLWVEQIGWGDFQAFMRAHHRYSWPNIQQQTMERLWEKASAMQRGRICGVKMNGEWAAMQLYIEHRNRLYLIQNAVSSAWRSLEPMPWLLHRLFVQCIERRENTRVHFMGSSDAGVARFNHKFGAVDNVYFEV